MAILVTCACGKQFKVKEELAGKRGKCTACGKLLSIPTLAPSASQEDTPPSPLRTCPTCQVELLPNAVICLNCGLDLRTGNQLSQSKPLVSAASSEPIAKVSVSSTRLGIAVAAGAVCLTGVLVIVGLLSRGGEAGVSVIAQPPNPGIQNGVTKGKGPSVPGVPSSVPMPVVPAAGSSPSLPPIAPQPPTARLPFEESFRVGRIAWQPVYNVQLTTTTPGRIHNESVSFRTKLKYDENGRASVDTTGYKSYSWTDRDASFGPEAVIKVTESVGVAEGDVKAGDHWVWDGARWVSKTVFDDGLSKAEVRVIDQLGGLAVSTVIRDPGAAVDDALDALYAAVNETPGELREKIKECRAQPTCLPAVAILSVPLQIGDIEASLGRYREKQDETMLFPTEEGGRQPKPVYWHRYGRLDIGVDFKSPVIVAVRIRTEN